MTEAAARPAKIIVPWTIKRNVGLIGLTLTFTGAGMQLAYGFGPLMVQILTGSAGLAGLSVALIGISRFLIAYPIGKVTDTFGRKFGILLGLIIALFGSLVLGSSMLLHNTLVFIVGLLVFGMGMNAAQQMRVAATDMFPSRMRAQALGYVAIGSLIGLCVMPAIIYFTDGYAKAHGYEPLALPWFAMPLLIIPGMLLVSQIRPDPKHIGQNLAEYYPGQISASAQQREKENVRFSPIELMRRVPILLAMVANSSGQANMSIVMVLTSLVLKHHGHTNFAIAVSHVFHAVGMFGFTVFLGMLADRFGRQIVMYSGVATALLGAVLVTFFGSYLAITIGTFLVGLGWAGGNVAATAFIADQTRTNERGRAIGLNDSFSAGASVAAALITGPLIALWGLAAAGMAAIVVAAIPFLLLVMLQGRGYSGQNG